jgi:hypothetical protein
VVGTILHELTHEHCQSYSERAVDSVCGKLLKQMSPENMQAIYEEYAKRRTRSKRLQDAEDGRFE